MTFAQALTAYIALNAMVAIAYLGLKAHAFATRGRVSARTELSFHYAVLTFTIGLSFAQPLMPKREFFEPPAKVWSAASLNEFAESGALRAGRLSLSMDPRELSIGAEHASYSMIVLVIVALLFGANRLVRDLRGLLRIRSRSFRLRKIGSVSIYANDEISVPFSHWLPFRNDVVVPTSLVQNARDFRTVVAHEIQHHRQRDTRWVYAMYALRVICAPNPFIHLWNRTLSEIQEFACDETLVDRKRVESREYARCLVEVATTAKGRSSVPACAAGLVFMADRKLLKRRIENMMNPTRTMGKVTTRLAAGLLALAMAGAACASQGLVQDRRVSMAEAKRMLATAKASSEMPVELNELVLKQLNRYIGTPEGRDFMRTALQRMETYRAVIGTKITEYGMPMELLAVPIAESGYKNMSEGESSTSMKSAGLWQFIPSTARAYGLHVDAKKDERLDVDLATDAALRYLESNRLRFKDWHLAILAYNMGENAVQKAMNATGAKDAWSLIRAGHEGDRDYLPKVMAAMLIMKNPESVR
ncbi:MAG: M56 and MltD domain-containing protein [Bdellovibrionota bacterium]